MGNRVPGKEYDEGCGQNGWRSFQEKRWANRSLCCTQPYALRSLKSRFLIKRQRGRRAARSTARIGITTGIRMDWSDFGDITIKRKLCPPQAEFDA